MRQAKISRKTKETEILLELNLDQAGSRIIASGSGFLDHMLDLFQKHSGIGFSLECKGDTHIDMHHSAEDIAICIGQALQQAVGDKNGIERYGFYYVPMDETLVRVVLDFAGRTSFCMTGEIPAQKIGNFETELVEHMFSTIAQEAKINLHIDLIRGSNAHHCIEGIFKAFARALGMAISPSQRVRGIPSTKGTLS
jgi:imidazoleglycerol-phosphate dehydratase